MKDREMASKYIHDLWTRMTPTLSGRCTNGTKAMENYETL